MFRVECRRDAPSADVLIAQKRRSLRELRRLPARPRSDFRADGSFRFADVLGEMRASKDGAELGARYGGDPYRAAAGLGIPVIRRGADALRALAGRPIMGQWLPVTRIVQLADNLSSVDAAHTLAHEIAHSRMGHVANSIDAERQADAWMRAFLAEAPKPSSRRR